MLRLDMQNEPLKSMPRYFSPEFRETSSQTPKKSRKTLLFETNNPPQKVFLDT